VFGKPKFVKSNNKSPIKDNSNNNNNESQTIDLISSDIDDDDDNNNNNNNKEIKKTKEWLINHGCSNISDPIKATSDKISLSRQGSVRLMNSQSSQGDDGDDNDDEDESYHSDVEVGLGERRLSGIL
jgi:predicted transcriptional regulator YheO